MVLGGAGEVSDSRWDPLELRPAEQAAREKYFWGGPKGNRHTFGPCCSEHPPVVKPEAFQGPPLYDELARWLRKQKVRLWDGKLTPEQPLACASFWYALVHRGEEVAAAAGR